MGARRESEGLLAVKTLQLTPEEFDFELKLAAVMGCVKFWSLIKDSKNLQKEAHGVLRAMIQKVGRNEFLAAAKNADADTGDVTDLSWIL